MKFRYKVLISNIVLVSLALGLAGYFMIRRNFEHSMETAVSSAIEGNNMVQSTVEYEFLKALNDKNKKIEEELAEIGGRVAGSMVGGMFSFWVQYDEETIYQSDDDEPSLPWEISASFQSGKKKYMIREEGEREYIYVSSYSLAEDKKLSVVTKVDITEVYSDLRGQNRYFQFVLLAVLCMIAVLMYIVSRFLTRHLERVMRGTEEIASGNYDKRVVVESKDEVGILAEGFNHMAAAVEEHVKQLREMVHKREQFVADFTHEVKTPMTAIIGYADTMRSIELKREEQLLALNYIFTEGKRLEELSDSLFTLLQLKEQKPVCEKIYIEDLIWEVERSVKPALEKKKLELLLDVKPGVLYGDKVLFMTALINIIDNARKASSEEQKIEIYGFYEKEDTYILQITDHGIGMGEEVLAHMWEEFYMGDKSRTRKEGGAGLGMSLTALILKQHGIRCKVESEVGKGTTFSLQMKKTEEESGQ